MFRLPAGTQASDVVNPADNGKKSGYRQIQPLVQVLLTDDQPKLPGMLTDTKLHNPPEQAFVVEVLVVGVVVVEAVVTVDAVVVVGVVTPGVVVVVVVVVVLTAQFVAVTCPVVTGATSG